MGLKVVNSKREVTDKLDAKVTVKLDGITSTFKEFVVVGFPGEVAGPVEIITQADVISLAVAMEVVKDMFYTNFNSLSKEDQDNVKYVLDDLQKVMEARRNEES